MIAIIGFGFVGQAVYSSLKNNYNCMIVDPKRGTTTKDEDFQKHMLRANAFEVLNGDAIDTIFICVPTPTAKDGSCDVKAFNSVYQDLKEFQGLVIIKSTIPKHLIPIEKNWVYNPEFLNANTATEDFNEQEYIVLGGEMDFTKKAQNFYEVNTTIDTKDVFFEHCSKDEASDFKYIRNIYQAYKVMFWEMVQDTTGNARKMSMMLESIPMGENTQVGMDGFRGFGGACLPKDVSAFNAVHKHKLTEFLLDYNEELS